MYMCVFRIISVLLQGQLLQTFQCLETAIIVSYTHNVHLFSFPMYVKSQPALFKKVLASP